MGWLVNIQRDDVAFGLAFLPGWVTKHMGMRHKRFLKVALSVRSCCF